MERTDVRGGLDSRAHCVLSLRRSTAFSGLFRCSLSRSRQSLGVGLRETRARHRPSTMRRVPPRLFGKPPDDLVDPGGVVVDHELAKDMSRRVVPGGDGATALCLRIPVREKSDGIVTRRRRTEQTCARTRRYRLSSLRRMFAPTGVAWDPAHPRVGGLPLYHLPEIGRNRRQRFWPVFAVSAAFDLLLIAAGCNHG